jgi:hypothetical protein
MRTIPGATGTSINDDSRTSLGTNVTASFVEVVVFFRGIPFCRLLECIEPALDNGPGKIGSPFPVQLPTEDALEGRMRL